MCSWELGVRASSPFTLGLPGQNQHALLHSVCISTPDNTLLLSCVQCEWEALYTCPLAKFFLVTLPETETGTL